MNASLRRVEVNFAVFAALSTALFGLFSYNSTYGYDQVEYLMIGRGMVDGHPLFAFAPSKGPGIYTLVAILSGLGVSFDHFSLSVIISLVYLLIIIATFATARRLFDEAVGITSAILVGLCVLFMSHNFLQPTGFVYLAGLGAYYLILRSLETRSISLCLLAGIVLGVGFQFKSVAAFYVVGVGLFLMLHAIRARDIAWSIRAILAMGTGFILSLGLAAAYFFLTGRGPAYIEWTFTFPLFRYPSNTLSFATTYKKLGWFHALLLLAVVWSCRPALRNRIYSAPAIQLSLCLGICSYAALLKTQAPHYFFPGATFFSLFIATVVVWSLRDFQAMGRRMSVIVAGGAVFLVLLAAGAVMHRPSALRRLVSLTDYRDEQAVAHFIKKSCPDESTALFFSDNQHLYWISHRYPTTPFINLNVQTAYLLRKHPDLLSKALDDPRLALVEFRRTLPWVEETEQFDPREFAAILDDFELRLKERFVPVEDGPKGYAFWRRL